MGRLSLPLSVLALGAVGCDLGFDPPSLLSGSPRILALQADPPEVRPMEVVTLGRWSGRRRTRRGTTCRRSTPGPGGPVC